MLTVRANSVLLVIRRRLSPGSPDLCSILPILCPGAQHCTMHCTVTAGWMVQRSSNLSPFPRSSGNLCVFLETFEKTSAVQEHFRDKSKTGACFPFPPPLESIFSSHFHSMGSILSPSYPLFFSPLSFPFPHLTWLHIFLSPLYFHIRKIRLAERYKTLRCRNSSDPFLWFLGETLC